MCIYAKYAYYNRMNLENHTKNVYSLITLLQYIFICVTFTRRMNALFHDSFSLLLCDAVRVCVFCVAICAKSHTTHICFAMRFLFHLTCLYTSLLSVLFSCVQCTLDVFVLGFLPSCQSRNVNEKLPPSCEWVRENIELNQMNERRGKTESAVPSLWCVLLLIRFFPCVCRLFACMNLYLTCINSWDTTFSMGRS